MLPEFPGLLNPVSVKYFAQL